MYAIYAYCTMLLLVPCVSCRPWHWFTGVHHGASLREHSWFRAIMVLHPEYISQELGNVFR